MKNQFAIGLLVAAGTAFATHAALAKDYGEGTMFSEIAQQQATPYISGATRAQVKAELAEAQRNGEIVSGDGTMFAEVAKRSEAPYAASVTREQVQAELRKALRDGSILSGDSVSLAALSPAWPTTPPSMLIGNALQAPRAN